GGRRHRRGLEPEPCRIARGGRPPRPVGAGAGVDGHPRRRTRSRASRRRLAQGREPRGQRDAAEGKRRGLGGRGLGSRRGLGPRLLLAARGWRARSLHGLHLDLRALASGTPALAGLALLWIGLFAALSRRRLDALAAGFFVAGLGVAAIALGLGLL